MEFEQQKPITDEYRENWQRIFEMCDRPPIVGNAGLSEFTATYPNGCPILSEPDKDDL
jgi:hypothetical protein